jgi:hypothetical protein
VNEQSGREKFWTLDQPVRVFPGTHICSSTPYIGGLVNMGVHVVIVIPLLQPVGGGAFRDGLWGVAAVMFVIWGVAFMLTPAIAPHALRRFVERRVREGRCGNCGYGVGGLPDQDPTGALRGPARCPECACRWPLVLPPAPNANERLAFRT